MAENKSTKTTVKKEVKKAESAVKKETKKVKAVAKKTVAKVEKKAVKVEKKIEKAVNKATDKKSKVDVDNATKYAIIKLAGVQLKVVEGANYEVNKLDLEKGSKFDVEEVLMVVDGDKVEIGKPLVTGAKVTLEVVSQKKDKKIVVFKYKSKSRYRKTNGHRSLITRVEVKSIKA